MTDEVAREGNRELAKFMGKSLRTVGRLMPSMINCGAVIPMLRGKPPRRVNIWFESSVKRFMFHYAKARREEKENPGG